MKRINSRRRVYLMAGLASAVLAFFWFRNGSDDGAVVEKKDYSEISLSINGLNFPLVKTKARTVQEFLEEQKIVPGEKDYIFPRPESRLSPRSKISLNGARKVSFREGKKKTDGFVVGLSVREALSENGIDVGADDLLVPAYGSLVREGEKIEITRVEIKLEKETKKIDFRKNVTEDSKMGWREKKISQAGQYGEKELTYRAVYHDGKLISRKLVGEKVNKEPVEEISVQGTYVKLGKKHDGLASWYAFRGGLFAANPWLPIGSHVKVTNLDNGKSVIVKINDRGPFVPGRIIDLDKVAFQKIASLGAGVIHIKMEEVLN